MKITGVTDTKENKAEKDLSETWAADAQDDLEEWIEEQGIQLRY
ncbi:hypothetical protein [Ruminococcus gauvreauii]|uniref:Uncharacterized protein n=1 Tax=Ruminococcus gauvreauii TaxID=438033 RepID=A0ABY5VD36_9FIRM|nr:hypothetical protein [Ruminococcus gauvreauii]UWP58212.1 hypothetical protein NQ502_12575 [Ruminococcus gauvreauii]